MTEPPNHWAKSVFWTVMLLVGIACLAVGIATDHWGNAVIGAVLMGVAITVLGLIRQGRNPHWMQGPLDRRAAARAGVAVPPRTPTLRQAMVFAILAAVVTLGIGAAVESTWAPVAGVVVLAVLWLLWTGKRERG